jgi:DNA mismatch endonuclease (patch repair protein)
MADILSKRDRGARMSGIGQHDTALELIVRKGLHKRGLRFRLSGKNLPCRPDVVFLSKRVAIFVHGCFWHGHWCRAGKLPGSNKGYWTDKIARNRSRDARQARRLRRLGWSVRVIWGCQLSSRVTAERTIDRVAHAITKRRISGEVNKSWTFKKNGRR